MSLSDKCKERCNHASFTLAFIACTLCQHRLKSTHDYSSGPTVRIGEKGESGGHPAPRQRTSFPAPLIYERGEFPACSRDGFRRGATCTPDL